MSMQEIAKVTLQNEMDLILAHRRTMRLAELAGLTLPAQTTFATAVSEVARNTIDHGKNGCLILHVVSSGRDKYLVAKINDEQKNDEKNSGLEYAKRLVSKYEVTTSDKETAIELFYYIASPDKIDTARVDHWRSMLRNEPAVSPYEEIKRKNEQLQELALKLQESEDQYKTVTNALPLIIFSLNEKGELIYANEWLKRLTGLSISQLNSSKWSNVVHPDDYEMFLVLANPAKPLSAANIKTQFRLRHRDQSEYYWHLASISPQCDDNGKLISWIGYCVDINAQKVYEETLKDNSELKRIQKELRENQLALEMNIADLNRSNLELQQFAYVASHDLQEPARKISYYSDYLLNKYGSVLDAKGMSHLHSMQAASLRMRTLINDLLSFAQVDRERAIFHPINLNQVTHDVVQDLEIIINEKGAQISIEPLPVIEGDESMMRQLFENLISNALKYSKAAEKPVINISHTLTNSTIDIFVQDNGIGFEQKYLPQMFTLFQRLHTSQQYEGTGLGLAICRKIVALHSGTITAVSELGKGSTFHITVPVKH